MFISFEGSDGSGKTTQIELLRTFLRNEGYDPLVTREPGGTKIGELIRTLILDPANAEMSNMTEMMLYAAARAQHVDELIRPALMAGRIVVSDRFIDSSIVYQGSGRGLGDLVAAVNAYATGDCVPDVTFLLKTDPKNSFGRIGSDPDRIEAEGAAYQQQIYEAYLALQQQHKERIIGIDASGTPEDIHAEIRGRVSELLTARGLSPKVPLHSLMPMDELPTD